MTVMQVFPARLVIGSLYRANGRNCYYLTLVVVYANDCLQFQEAQTKKYK